MGTLSQRELEDYLNEFHDYLDSSAGSLGEEETTSAAEESEQDAEWLREAGFEFLVDCFKDDKDENDLCDGMMCLTHQQAATVRRRYEQFKATAGRRRRFIKSRPPDVRDVFAHGSESNASVPSTFMEEQPRSKSPSLSDSTRQSSVDESRVVFKTDLPEESKHKSNWREHFLRSGYKQGYKLTHLFHSPGPKSESGVEVLSYQARSSMKGSTPRPVFGRQSSLGNLPPTAELEEDLTDQEYEFEVLGRSSNDSDELPEVKMIPNHLGITYPSDVSAEDLRKIHPLALIEVTAILDKHGVSYSRRKATKRKLQDSTVFGVPLSEIVQEDLKKSPSTFHIPWVFRKLVNHLERRGLCEEGILRIPGSRQKIENLKSHIEKYSGSHSRHLEEVLEMAAVHDVAAVLKQFIRELPEPLLANSYLDAFLHVPDIPYFLDQVKALNLLVVQLPEAHRDTLRRLVDFLGLVADSEDSNKMSLQNVSVIMAPNLFPPCGRPSADHKRDLNSEMLTATLSAKVTKMLVKYRDVLWTIPPGLLKQIRQQNEELALHKFNKTKKLVKKHKEEVSKERSYSAGSDQPLRSVDIRFPADGSQLCVVQIDGSTTVEDVVEVVISANNGCTQLLSFTKTHNGRDTADHVQVATTHIGKSSHLHCLYELGGNIVERRVDSKARMVAIARQNPTAEWTIRCQSQ